MIKYFFCIRFFLLSFVFLLPVTGIKGEYLDVIWNKMYCITHTKNEIKQIDNVILWKTNGTWLFLLFQINLFLFAFSADFSKINVKKQHASNDKKYNLVYITKNRRNWLDFIIGNKYSRYSKRVNDLQILAK